MSNSSGFSGFPPKISGADSFPPSKAELKAKIIAIRGEARVQKVRERMEGEVIRHNRNGTTDIKTPRGEITVELPPKERPPEGARILLDVPKGEPPRQVTISRVSAGEAPQAEPKQAEETVQAPRTAPRSEHAKITPETSLSLSRQTTEQSRAPQAVPSVPPLREGDFLRLTPLPSYESVLPLEHAARAAVVVIAARVTQAAFQTVQSIQQKVVNIAQPLAAAPLPQTSLSGSIQQNVLSPLLSFSTAQQQPNFNTDAAPQIQPLQTPLTEFLGLPLPRLQTVLNNLAVSVTQQPVATQLTAPQVETLQTVPSVTALQKAIPAVQNMAQIITENTTVPQKAVAHVQDVKINTIFPPSVSLKADDVQAVQKIPQSAQLQGIQSQGAQNIETLLTARNSVASQAILIGKTAQSLPVLSVFTPQAQSWQNFTIPVQPQNLVTGTRLEVLSHIMPTQQTVPTSAMATAVLPPFIPFEFFSGASWPAAEEVLKTLQQAVPQAAQLLGQTTPNATAPMRLPAAALLFVAAVRGGDIAGWLGDKNIDLLKRLGKGDAINRMARDMGGLQRTSSEPVSQDWRGMALPMMSDGELSKMMLYYRHDKDETGNGEVRRGTRFIFDLNLSKMGAVQIDGLHRPITDKQSKMDLIVRTMKPISAGMRKTMRAVYLDALQQADAIGDISFQNEQEKFVTVDMPKSAVSI